MAGRMSAIWAAQRPAPRLQLVLSLAPPLSTTAAQHRQLVDRALTPLLTALQAQESACLALHLGGHLLDYLARHAEPVLVQLRALQRTYQCEVLGGPFYGGLSAELAEQDVRGQVEMAREFWESSLGTAPQGFYLPIEGWSPELPRLLSDTGLAYGFVDDTQVTFWGQGNLQPSLGPIERGGDRLAAFVVASQLSAALAAAAPAAVGAWLQEAAAVAQQHDQGLATVGLAPSMAQAAAVTEKLAALWTASVAATDGPTLSLPEANYTARGPAVGALQLRAPTLPRPTPAVDVLQRRMLHGSALLRDAIAVMEDENFDEAWSDKLATVQRLVFAAQSSEAYGRGSAVANDAHAAALQHRSATWSRLLQAQSMVDALRQDGHTWLQLQQVDLDGDLADDVVVTTAALCAWLAPARGGPLYSLDDRRHGRMLFDIDVEPWAADGPIVAGLAGMGLTQFLCAGTTLPKGLVAGSALDVLSEAGAWQVEQNGVGDEGDYRLALRCELDGSTPVQIDRQVVVRRHRPACELSTTLHGDADALYGLQIPLRLPEGPLQIHCDGRLLAPQALQNLSGVRQLQLLGADGVGVALKFAAPLEVRLSLALVSGSAYVVPFLSLRGAQPAKLAVDLALVSP